MSEMEKTEKGRGDQADDVEPERSIIIDNADQTNNNHCDHANNYTKNNTSLRHNNIYLSSYHALSLSSVSCQCPSSELIQTDALIQKNLLSNYQSVNNATQHPLFNIANNQFIPLKKNSYQTLLVQTESLANTSIADEHKNIDMQMFSSSQKPIFIANSRRVHSMTEKLTKVEEKLREKRRIEGMNYQAETQEIIDVDNMNESLPQIIPKFSYRVSMPSNIPKNQTIMTTQKSNALRYQILQETAKSLPFQSQKSPAIVNFFNLLNTSYELTKDTPQQCAHLLLTLELQLSLLLSVTAAPIDDLECSSFNSLQELLFTDQDDPGDEGVI